MNETIKKGESNYLPARIDNGRFNNECKCSSILKKTIWMQNAHSRFRTCFTIEKTCKHTKIQRQSVLFDNGKRKSSAEQLHNIKLYLPFSSANCLASSNVTSLYLKNLLFSRAHSLTMYALMFRKSPE